MVNAGRKRNSASLFSVCFALLMTNIEYAIVMPSLFLYLKRIDPSVPGWAFGLILGTFHMASIATSPFFGFWIDRRPLKEVITLCLCLGALGNVVYAFANSVYLVFVGRMISGIGGNLYGAAMTYVVRVSTVEERSSLAARIALFCYMGMLGGPALNYPLSLLGRYPFGIFTFDSLNAPGFVMVFLLAFACALVNFLFIEPPVVMEETEEQKAAKSHNDKRCCGLAKYKPLVTSLTLMSVILFQFLVQFTQISLETIVTPVMMAWYGFGQLENSIVYSVITVIFFFWFAVIIFLAKRLKDRTLIAVGAGFFGLALISAVAVMMSQPNSSTYQLPLYLFSLITACIVSGIPFFISSMNSLFSKLVADPHIMGMGQALLTVSTSGANIVGPIVGGLFLGIMNWFFVMLLCVWGCIALILILRWKQLNTAVGGDASTAEVVSTEKTPLFASVNDKPVSGGKEELPHVSELAFAVPPLLQEGMEELIHPHHASHSINDDTPMQGNLSSPSGDENDVL